MTKTSNMNIHELSQKYTDKYIQGNYMYTHMNKKSYNYGSV